MDLVDVLLEVLERKASDLHIGAGDPPVIRVNGELEYLDYPRLSSNDTRELVYSILSPKTSASASRTSGRSTSPTRCRAEARFRVERLSFQRNSISAAFRLIPVEIPKLDDLGLPHYPARVHLCATRLCARHRADGLR